LPMLGKFDLLLTDPPYGIGYAGSQSVGGTDGRTKAYWRTWDTTWDETRIDDDTIREAIGKAGTATVWGGNFYGTALPVSGGLLVWDKTQRGMSFGDGEAAWTTTVKSMRIYSLNRCFVTTDGKVHPTQKPLALMKWCIGLVPEAKTVLDPFMGSGTTLVAAKLLGLRAVGIEINREYCHAAVERLRQGVLDFGSEG